MQMNNGYKLDLASFPTLATKNTPRSQDMKSSNFQVVSLGAQSPPSTNKSDNESQFFLAETPKVAGHDVSWSARLKNKSSESVDYQKVNELISTPSNIAKSSSIVSEPNKKQGKSRQPESINKKSNEHNQVKKPTSSTNSNTISPIIDSLDNVKIQASNKSSFKPNGTSLDILSNDAKNIKFEVSSSDNLIILPKSPEINPKNRNKKKEKLTSPKLE